MSGNLLQTKLYKPALRPSLVPRPHLIEKLNQGLHRKLTLISAPAGFGKTTLVSEWIAGCKRPFAWLSLDDGDADLPRFLTYFITALQTVALSSAEGVEPSLGKGVLGMLQSPQLPPTDSVLTTLINEIAAVSEEFALVLDDYHVVDNQSIDQALTFLLEHQPPHMHLVITTREDPNLPLARLRVRGQLTELRTADLRFTTAETAVFLNQMMGLDLSAANIAALEARTEGWIAGLQLAAISMQGQADLPGFIKAFTGDNRYIVDYLVEEVLQRQSEPVRSFLLQTSILDRLTGALCDAVRFGVAETPYSPAGTAATGQEDGKEMLETLERGNLFVVPLDDRRQWYRYHHLFADVLRARLPAENPNQVPELHRRASRWYEQQHYPYDAIHHAFAAEDFARAASLVQQTWSVMRQNYSDTTLLRWVRKLPDELLRARPVLCVYYADALLSSEPDTAEAYLRHAERWLEAHSSGAIAQQTAVVTEAEFRSLPGMIAFIRAYQASARRNLADTVKYGQQALALLPEDDYLYRGSAGVLLGLAHWTGGELAAAHRSITDSLSSMQMSGNVSAVIGATYLLADLRMAQGRLHQAKSSIQQALKLAADYGKPIPQGTADLHVLLSELHRERNDLETARQHLLTSQKLGKHAALLVTRHRWYRAMAGIKEVEGDLGSALDLLDEAERLQIGDPTPDVQPIAALKARVWIRQGRLTDALAWKRERGLSIDDDLHYLHLFEHITLARILIAQYRNGQVHQVIADAARLLARLLEVAQSGGWSGSLIEILILQALAHHAQQDITAALPPLQQALKLAEPEGYVRCFVNEGAPMAHLLQEVISREVVPEYGRQLLTAFSPTQSQPTDQSALAEPLSERELEVLVYIARGFTNQEIADQLVLSLYTIKAHARNIYGRLDVSNRTEAATKARELGILPQS